MISQDILSRLLQQEELPTLPQVMAKILETIEDERSSSQDLTRILECDYAISARVLRMANSAFYGLPSRVESIRRAIVVIGFDAVKMLALATSVFDALTFGKDFPLDPDDFWMHSLGAAKSAQTLAKSRRADVSPEACFTAALLHDIGKFLLALTLKERYREICDEAAQTSRPLRLVEREVIETDHAAVGGWIAQKWRFPEAIVAAIERQYMFVSYDGAHQAAANIVGLSDIVSRMAEFGWAGDPVAEPGVEAPPNALGVDAAALAMLADDLRSSREATRELLSLMKPK